MAMTKAKSLLMSALALCSLGVCAADDVAGWQINWDNDLWAKGKTDRWYTNGLRLSWTFDKPPGNELSRLFLEGGKWFLWDEPTPTLTYSVGQAMYTPRDITVAGPQPNDRPWGAFLYFSVTAHAYRDKEFRATELKVGTTGRYALGEQAQSLIHRITSSPRPEGWNQQLRTRPGLQLTHVRVHRFGDTLVDDRFGFQWGWGASTGTLRTRANLDVAMVVGNLRGTNAPLLIGNEGDFVVQDFNNRPQFRTPFAYIAGNVTGVVHNHFIEGRTPYGRSNLEPRRSYTVLTAGLSLPLHVWLNGSWPRVVYAQSLRSPEFRSRVSRADEQVQRWGTFSLHWDLE